MAESRKEMECRLRADGRWAQFVRDLKILKNEGMSVKEARQKLQVRYIPVADGGHDVSVHGPMPPVIVAANEVDGRKRGPRSVATTEQELQPVLREVFAGKKCDERTAVQWVFENMAVLDVKPSEAPSCGAWGLLQRAKLGIVDIDALWSKLLPTKNQMEVSDKFLDDGRDALGLIERLKLAMVVEETNDNNSGYKAQAQIDTNGQHGVGAPHSAEADGGRN